MNKTPDQVAARAGELFQQGFCCAESVLLAVAESAGIQSELIPKIATGLCGGLARTGSVCGAVSGGVLALSLRTGRSRPTESREENHRLVREFLRAYQAALGSTICEKLIGCRLDTPEGHRFFEEHHLRQKCAGFTREAARLVAQLLEPSGTFSPNQGVAKSQ